MPDLKFLSYLLVMAGVTYLVRMIPLVLVKKKVKNLFLLSFLHYVPIAVLSVMTIPACFYATSNIYSAAAGFAVALVLAYLGKSLLSVAAFACMGVFLVEIIMQYI